ncbi:zf-CCCH domain-containing protein [Cephalotus follicularis]|uniref:Zf-CCCH domain-containing protein n=1 Tax=Cephalotus follicularis TaxID=3775 RepID=A0A1Q3D4E5_CEPFO|nr:zf-CCCH domain-containing protein [Cephalotus follicularis]
MSFPEPPPPFMPPPPQPYGDDIGVWPQYPMNKYDQQFDPHSQFDHHHPPPHKRPRNSEEEQMNSLPYPPLNSRNNPPNPPVFKGTTNIFFKTRVCAKFKQGACRNGENCNFAHGEADLRQPPPNWKELVGVGVGREEDRWTGNWEDDQRIIHRMKLCKKFYNGEECPYGDRCNFLHEEPGKFRDDLGGLRESSAISIGTNGSATNHNEINRPVNNAVGTMKIYRKTKLCSKWETGQCPFGEKCNFAHGPAELQNPGGCIEWEVGNIGFDPTKPPFVPPVNDASPNSIASVPVVSEGGQAKKCLLKWKGPKKINCIYGDWLDDLPFTPSQVES